MNASRSDSRPEVRVERQATVLRVTLDRAKKHNALSRAVLADLRRAFIAARDDEQLRCVVLTSAGSRYFAAGGDLVDLAEVRQEREVRAMGEDACAALDAVREFPLPVVACLNGDAIGGGAELALACDLRVMRDGAHLGYVHGRLGITPAWGGGADLAALVGPARALRMTTRGELLTAATAAAWGLADVIAPAAALEQALQDFIAPLLTQSLHVLRACKAQSLAARRGLSHDARRRLEQDAFVESWVHPDHWAALRRIMPKAG